MSLGRLLVLFGIALAVVLPVRLFILEPIYIASPSMEPKFPVGAHVFMDKLTFKLRDPRPGEVIVFAPPVPSEEGHELVKRVIAVPGDIVEMREKKVLVNGRELDEPYVQHTRKDAQLQGDTMEALNVPKDSYFVLGDNRDESNDSSVWKDGNGEPVRFLKRKNVRGLVRGFY